MTDWNAINAFMGAVVPWPGDQDPGYVNLQNSYVDRRAPGGKRNGKYPVGPGLPYRDISAFLSQVARLEQLEHQQGRLVLHLASKADCSQ